MRERGCAGGGVLLVFVVLLLLLLLLLPLPCVTVMPSTCRPSFPPPPPDERLRTTPRLNATLSTESLLNDLERAVDDSVACVRGLCRDPRFVPGGGATEMELAHQIYKHGESQVGGEGRGRGRKRRGRRGGVFLRLSLVG